jgi:methyl coenzyme M reductase subunit C
VTAVIALPEPDRRPPPSLGDGGDAVQAGSVAAEQPLEDVAVPLQPGQHLVVPQVS